MNISNNKVVSLAYELKVSGIEGSVENINEEKPFTFIFGSGNLMKEFEVKIDGLKVSDTFDFTLASEEAYGSINKDAIAELPKSMFVIDGKPAEDMLTIGKIVPMKDNTGKRMDGKIVEIGDEIVKMDFNHPMAGRDLSFKGSVVGIREASEEELNHRHVHGSSDCEGCTSCEDPSQGCD